MSTHRVPYQLIISGLSAEQLRVASFTGREELSKAYTFDIVVTDAQSDDLTAVALGKRAAFFLRLGEMERAFYGVIAAVEQLGLRSLASDAGRAVQYRMRLVPRLFLLRRRRRSRIFQNMSADAIVSAVLAEVQIKAQWRLVRKYPVREHCTQYEETDYAFIKRLCAESGIYFHFAEGGPLSARPTPDEPVSGDSLVFSDDASFYPNLLGVSEGPSPLYFLATHNTAVSQLDKVSVFTTHTSVRPAAAVYADYDPERPLTPLISTATAGDPLENVPKRAVAAAVSEIEKPSGLDAFSGFVPEGADLEVYEHHGYFLFPKWSVIGDEAPLMLRQHRRKASTASGESGCPRLAPGRRFRLVDHPVPHLDRDYAITAVEHRGQSGALTQGNTAVYENRFDCVPSDITFVPKRPKRRSVQVALTATVVGPSGDDIHVDAMGQIKVRFRWDRDSKAGDQSSCWIRTMQPIAGAGWGAQIIPRVGMEVIVVFEGGDPDKPLVIGSVYNGSHPPPFPLPANKTRSGLRTQSSPGGGGSNELSFEDKAKQEQVYLHAQRDFDEVVEHDHTTLVRGSEKNRVAGARSDIIGGGHEVRVSGLFDETVLGQRKTHIDGSRSETITGNSQIWVEHDATTRIGGKEQREIDGAHETTVKDDLTIRAGGCFTTLVGTSKAKRSYVLHVEGATDLSSSEVTEIRSDKAIVLSCGRSSLRITDEAIELISPALEAGSGTASLSVSGDDLRLNAKKQLVLRGDTILLKASQASLGLAANAQLDGAKVLLNSPEQADKPLEDKRPEPTAITLTDQHGKPLGNQRYLIQFADGAERSGVLDKDGKAEVLIDGPASIVFPGLRDVKEG